MCFDYRVAPGGLGPVDRVINEVIAQQAAELRQRFAEGGPREGFVRAVIYVRIPQLAADERSYLMLRQIREEHAQDMSLQQFKDLFREQFMLVLLDPEQAIQSLPVLLDGKVRDPASTLAALQKVVQAGGPLPDESTARLERVTAIYEAVVAAPQAEGRAYAKRPTLKVAGSDDDLAASA